MRSGSKTSVALLIAALSCIHTPVLADGSSDQNFNNGNSVLQSGGSFQEANVIAFQGNKILLAGSRDNDFVVARFTTSGQLDTTFGTAGYVTVDIDAGSNDVATGLAVTSTSEIYVYGTAYRDLAIVKLSENGARINSFGLSGVLVVSANFWGAYSLASADIEIYEDAVYFAAALRIDNGGSPGAFRYSLYKMDHTGAIDSTFSNDVLGLSIGGYLNAMVIDADENIYLAGNEHANVISKARVVKINPAGILVNTFANAGVLDVPITSKRDSSQTYNASITELKVSSTGQIFGVGYISEPNYLATDEVFILNFNSLGIVNPYGASNSTGLFDLSKGMTYVDRQSIAIQNDGKILVSVTWSDISTMVVNGVVARFTTSGDLDSNFGTNGIVSFPADFFVHTAQLNTNQKLVVAGRNGDLSSSDIFMSRLRTAIPPSAPVIGAATATGSTTATVSFTAPISNGGATITGYTATASLGGFTGTLVGATAGTITVTGLSASTDYTFTVTATNSEGTSAASSASNPITTSTASSGGGGTGGGGTTTSTTAADELRRQQEAAAAAKQKQDQELREILSLVPTIAGLAQGIAGLGNSLLLPQKCVKGKTVKKVKAGAKCPKGYKVKK
jgi:uncharacterized delta-60 repeat protein